MHITIIAMGSRGDVTPYAVLGGALRRAGHTVRLASMGSFGGLAERYDLDFYRLPGDAEALVQQGLGAQGGLTGSKNPLRLWKAIRKSYGTLALNWVESFSARELLETDLYINQLPGGLFGWDLAEKNRQQMMAAAVIPLTMTRTAPVMGFPALPLPGFNRFSYLLAEQLVWSFFGPSINRWRKKTLGLPPHPPGGYFARMRRQTPVLNGFSPLVVPPPADWGTHIHTVGYWLPEEAGWQPSTDLLRFLEAGSKPVFIGFGSMAVPEPKKTTALLLAALERTGQRGILHAGWAGLAQDSLPDTVFRIDYAPYAWLFPRMKMIVHHGGSGTTAFGLRSGAPSMVVSFTYDQPFWGQRIAALGAGPGPIPFNRLAVDSLVEAISNTVENTAMFSQAAQVAAVLHQEDGPGSAVKVIEKYLG
jgi:sterol 3beta-glucosyltransferase